MASTSQVNATIPVDGAKVAKADLRANFLTIKTELTSVLRKTRKAWKIAFGEESV